MKKKKELKYRMTTEMKMRFSQIATAVEAAAVLKSMRIKRKKEIRVNFLRNQRKT
jgi:hypothetical protein